MSVPQVEAKEEQIIIVRRSGGGDEGHHGGAWKIAYADFMTAMMALFLVMWLINSANEATKAQVASYFNPVKLTDNTTAPKGLEDMSTESSGGQKAAGETEGEDKNETATKEGKNQPKYSEEELFGDPYGILTKIVDKAAKEQKNKTANIVEEGDFAGQDGRTDGEAFRDPFDPDSWKVPNAEEGADPMGTGSQTSEQRMAKADLDAGEGQNSKKDMKVAAAKQAAEEPDAKEMPAASTTETTASKAKAAKASEMAQKKLAKDIQAHIKQIDKGLGKSAAPAVDVRTTKEGVLISLSDSYDFGMFASASSEPKPKLIQVMGKIAKLLKARPGSIVVRGHTDARPFKSKKFDNWRLSTARANMARYMLIRGGITAKRFERVEGYADRVLKLPKQPEAAANRRIEILLRKDVS